DCRYAEMQQRNCLFCLHQYQPVAETYCPTPVPDYLTQAYYTPESIPDNPNMTYIVVNSVPSMGGGTYPAVQGSWNYHLELPEFLIKNEKNFSYVCSTDDFTCRTEEQTLLRQKFGSSIQGGTSVEHQIWDMAGPRDMSICGYYVRSPYGPSYLQRFLALPKYNDPKLNGNTPYSSLGFGIESFNVGAWAGGYLDQGQDLQSSSRNDPEVRSRVDYQYYATSGQTIPYCAAPFYVGMAGCKSWEMCANNILSKSQGVGRFAISDSSDNPAYDYNIDSLLYDAYDWGGVRSCN
ncbi:MAG: hypothetical protein V1822_01470, partial [Candidatus Micrarchaeota archaeon]